MYVRVCMCSVSIYIIYIYIYSTEYVSYKCVCVYIYIYKNVLCELLLFHIINFVHTLFVSGFAYCAAN